MWVLVAVYGATQPEFKEEFLTELVRACNVEKLPIMVGGDFNIMRNLVKKKTMIILMGSGLFFLMLS